MDHELDFLTYYRKMRQLKHALKVLFNEKERYLLRKQHDFTLQEGLNSVDSDCCESVDSQDEKGPLKNKNWWQNGLSSWNSRQLMQGVLPPTSELEAQQEEASKSSVSEIYVAQNHIAQLANSVGPDDGLQSVRSRLSKGN